MKVAGERFIQSFSKKVDVGPLLNNPFDLSFSGLSKEEIEDVELVDILLAAAEKERCQEFELAIKLLCICDRLSSINGNPVQRVAYYFSEALREKIDQELMGLKKEVSFVMDQMVMDAGSASLAHRQEGRNIWKQDQGSKVEAPGESGCIDFLSSDRGFYQDDSSEKGFISSSNPQQEHQFQSFSGCGHLGNLRFNGPSPPMEGRLEEFAKLGEIKTSVEDVVESKKEERCPLSLPPTELLKSDSNGFKRLNGARIHEKRLEAISLKEPTRKLSTEDIMRIAGQRFIQYSSQKVDVMLMLSNPFNLSFFGLSCEEIKDIELVDILLASAEKVSNKEFELAGRLLGQCDCFSSKTGNPVQRVVCHFSEALRVKIDRGSKVSANKVSTKDIFEVVMHPSSVGVAYRQEVPFCKVEQSTGIQAIVENVAKAKKVHVIDLSLKHGAQWTVLMQALATRHECPLELLKITAVGTASKEIEDTGRWLLGFAQTINLPFSFMAVTISDMLDLEGYHFKIDDEEATVVYSEFFLWTMIGQPALLDSLMGVIRKIRPCIMVVIEVESNINSPDFVSRFIENLFYAGAYFDCFEACMERDARNRLILESILGQGMKNIVVAEGEERRVRHVKIDVWRAFFSRFGMEETDLSMSSLFQADQMVKDFGREKSCTLDMNGKCLIIGWKGTPLHSLSVWKFI